MTDWQPTTSEAGNLVVVTPAEATLKPKTNFVLAQLDASIQCPAVKIVRSEINVPEQKPAVRWSENLASGQTFWADVRIVYSPLLRVSDEEEVSTTVDAAKVK